MQSSGLMDGKRSMQEIWEAACERLGDDMPTQGEVISLLSYLHQNDALQSDKPPDIADLAKRSRKDKSSRWMAMARSPAAMSFPVWDPNSFLDKSLFLVRPFLSKTGASSGALLLVIALLLLGMHWQELSSNVTDRVLSDGKPFPPRPHLPFFEATPRVRPCLCSEEIRRGGPRDGRDAHRLHAPARTWTPHGLRPSRRRAGAYSSGRPGS